MYDKPFESDVNDRYYVIIDVIKIYVVQTLAVEACVEIWCDDFQIIKMSASNGIAASVTGSDPRRPNKVVRYRPPPVAENSSAPADDPIADYMNLLGMVFSMCGLMMKLKWCAWVAVYCAFISFANSRYTVLDTF